MFVRPERHTACCQFADVDGRDRSRGFDPVDFAVVLWTELGAFVGFDDGEAVDETDALGDTCELLDDV